MGRRADIERVGCTGLWIGAGLWLVIGLFMVLREPVWRVLYENGFVARQARERVTSWRDLDRDALSDLATMTSTLAGLPASEDLLREALVARRRLDAPGVGELQWDDDLLRQARALASLWEDSYAARRGSSEARWRHALWNPQELSATEVAYAFPTAVALPRDQAAASEVVEGWLRDEPFASLLLSPRELRGAVGVTGEGGAPRIVVILVEPMIEFETALSSSASAGDALELAGRAIGDERPELLFSAPDDAGFQPLAPTWEGEEFELIVPLSGTGTYAIQAADGSRTSAPFVFSVR